MPEHDNEHDNTSLPEDKKLSDLYSQTRNEPLDTTALDDKILSAAREELAGANMEKGPQEKSKPANIVRLSSWRRWSTPIASAACLLLGVSLAFNIILYQQTDSQPELPALQAPIADVQGPQGIADVKPAAMQRESQDFALELSAEPAAKKKVANEFGSKPADSLRARKPKALSKAEADEIFQGIGEIAVTSSLKQPKKSLSPEMAQRVDDIIQLLKNGQLADARQQLKLLIEAYPELEKP